MYHILQDLYYKMCAAKSSKEADRDHLYPPGMTVQPVILVAIENEYKPEISTQLSIDGKQRF
jgi:hypothetical protein